jgi:hypothetical protein
MIDDTEETRRFLTSKINSVQAQREELEKKHGQVWDTQELTRDFTVKSFLAPFVSVVRKADGVPGALLFQHDPRYYFNFTED